MTLFKKYGLTYVLEKDGIISFKLDHESEVVWQIARQTCLNYGLTELASLFFKERGLKFEDAINIAEKHIWNEDIKVSFNSNTCNDKSLINKLIGDFGEFVTHTIFDKQLNKSRNLDYDFLSTSGCKIDVKFKPRNVRPKRNYEFTIPEYYKEKGGYCDTYIFGQLAHNMKDGYIIGYMDFKNFWENAKGPTLVKYGNFNKSDLTSEEKHYIIQTHQIKRFKLCHLLFNGD